MGKSSHLLIVAHPDDETIFFGGTVMSLKQRGWKIIVVTDGNADGQGKLRHTQFSDACAMLGVRNFEQWDFPDRFENRLDIDRLMERLAGESANNVFTHGIIGEYSHPHHQDVSYAVHRHFQKRAPVWSVAYNSFASKTVRLTKTVFQKKAKILSDIYLSETIRFASILPLMAQEGFHRTSLGEIEHLYSYLTGQSSSIDPKQLKNYRWFAPYLEEQKKTSQNRRF